MKRNKIVKNFSQNYITINDKESKQPLGTIIDSKIADEIVRLWNSEPQELKLCHKTITHADEFPKSLIEHCCCECQHLKVLYSHPWIDGYDMGHVKGFACYLGFDDFDACVDAEQHGICEFFELGGE